MALNKDGSSGIGGGIPAQTFKELIDTPAAAGGEDTILAWDDAGNLKNTVIVAGRLPTGYISWPNGPTRVTATNFRLNAPLIARCDSNLCDVTIGGNKNNDIGTSGVGGINATQFPATADTFYNIRALNDSTGVNAANTELIELGTSPALPAGYDSSVVLWPPMLTTAAAQFVSAAHAVLGNSVRTYLLQNEGASRVLLDGAAIVNTTIDLSTLVPVGPRVEVHLNVGFLAGAGSSPADHVNINVDETVTGGVNQSIGVGVLNATDKLRQNVSMVASAVAAVKYLNTDLNTSGTNRTDVYVRGFTTSMRY
jgi:hypothetical protein